MSINGQSVTSNEKTLGDSCVHFCLIYSFLLPFLFCALHSFSLLWSRLKHGKSAVPNIVDEVENN